MVEKALILLGQILGKDNSAYLWILAQVDLLGQGNLGRISILSALFVWLLFLSALTWKKWRGYNLDMNIDDGAKNFASYFEQYGTSIIIRFFVGTAIIFFVFGGGGAIDILEAIFKIFGFDRDGHALPEILSGFDTDSKIYKLSNGWGAIIFIGSGLIAIYHAFIYYIVNDGAESLSDEGGEGATKHSFYAKSFGTLCLVTVILIFSVIPELVINNFYFKPFQNTTIYDYITGQASLSSESLR